MAEPNELTYKRIIHGIQALRRRVELYQCPVLGGAGIRAFCYPHQLYVVHEILQATRIRHLLADEVGLGKTLEALMIINALRIRNKGQCRVGIVVGSEERAKQWREEIFGRFSFSFWANRVQEKYPLLFRNGNIFFQREFEDPDSNTMEAMEDGFTLVYPQTFDTNKLSLEPENIDLLILDEIHNFPDVILHFLGVRSSEYQNVLLLSATPSLGESKRALQLLTLLEPDLAELAQRRETSVVLSNYPIIGERILRSKRTDFPKTLPQRETQILYGEPLKNDLDRFSEARRLMRTLLQKEILPVESAVLFIRRSVIGGQSLFKRVEDYKRRFKDYDKEWGSLQKRCALEQGDPRFDMLADYLLDFFSRENYSSKKLKIVIAAQDMPTVYYLRRRLKNVFPEKKILIFEQERNRTTESDIEENSTDSLNRAEESNSGVVEKFWKENFPILIAHNDAREALNFQNADALLFYSLPWKPIDMEQWLGRVSRLGLREKKTVEIRALVMRGMIDEKIANEYQSLNIFNQPLDIDKDQDILQNLTDEIRDMALYDTNRPSAPKKHDDSGESLMHIVPNKDAQALFKRVRKVCEPVIIRSSFSSDLNYPEETALDHWLNLLKDHQLCFRSKESDTRFKNKKNSHYYKFDTLNIYKGCSVDIPVLNVEPQIFSSPFILRRSNIQLPPRELVPMQKRNDHYEVPLQFFNFGSELHDGLLDAFGKWLDKPKRYDLTVLYENVVFQDTAKVKNGKYLIGIFTVARRRREHPTLSYEEAKKGNVSQNQMHESVIRRFETSLAADDRFLDLCLPGSLEILAYDGDRQTRIEPEQVYGFLTHLPNRVLFCKASEIRDEDNYYRIMKKALRGFRPKEWQQNFQPALDKRIDTLNREERIQIDLLDYKIALQEQKITTETNSATVRLNYEPAKRLLEEERDLVRQQFSLRRTYLTDGIQDAAFPCFECRLIMKLNVDTH